MSKLSGLSFYRIGSKVDIRGHMRRFDDESSGPACHSDPVMKLTLMADLLWLTMPPLGCGSMTLLHSIYWLLKVNSFRLFASIVGFVIMGVFSSSVSKSLEGDTGLV